MAAVGRKPKPEEQKIRDGTTRKDRVVVPLVPQLEGEVKVPSYLTGVARERFEEKAGIYARRNQSIVGLERALAVYCQIEVEIEYCLANDFQLTVADINQYRYWCNEFLDTPAAQHGKMSSRPTKNRFTDHGKPPEKA